MKRNALIVGSTGLIGGNLVTLLSNANTYDQITLPQRRAQAYEDPSIRSVAVDFDHFDIPQLERVDDFFCCLGTTIKKAGSKEAFKKVDYDYTLTSASFSIKKGAKRCFIVSSLGADTESSFFYSQVKGQVERDIQDLGFQEVYILRPSLLLGKRDESRLGEDILQVIMPLMAPMLFGRLKKYRAIKGKSVAKAMAQIANIEKGKPGIRIIESDEIHAIASLGTNK